MVENPRLDDSRVLECVSDAVITTVSAIAEYAPTASDESPPAEATAVIGSVNFSGELMATFELALTAESGPALARAFLGVPIDFDNPTMDDTVKELVNVIAGEIAANFAVHGVEACLGLPDARRTEDLASESTLTVCLTGKGGRFWIGVIRETASD